MNISTRDVNKPKSNDGVKPNSHDIINQITRIDSGLGTLYTSHYKIGYSIPAIVKMDVLSGTYILPIVKMDIYQNTIKHT